MTRIDFYILPEAEDTGPVLTACKLCDKAVSDALKVYVHAPDAGLAEDLDSALWSFKQNSFIGHERLAKDTEQPELCSVLIGAGTPPETHQDVLINLGAEVPGFFSRYARVLEIVHGDAAMRAQSRERFKFYRDRGYALETHKL